MRENRPSGSEGGVMQSNASSLPLFYRSIQSNITKLQRSGMSDPERTGANDERSYKGEHAAPLGLAIHSHIGSINMPRLALARTHRCRVQRNLSRGHLNVCATRHPS